MKERTYEYGQLRSELLRHALEHIELVGHEGLELRQLAALAGASRSAPHYYFASRDALLVEMAQHGWSELEKMYERILAGPETARERLAEICRAYVALAADAPQLFRLMYHLIQKSQGSEKSVWQADAFRAYWIYEGLFAEVLTTCDAKQVRTAALSCWSAISGFAQLRQIGGFDVLLRDVETEDALFEELLAHHIP